MLLPVSDYDLAETLTSGQAFRWREDSGGWVGVIDRRWVRLSAVTGGILAETTSTSDWRWLIEYLQSEVDLGPVLAKFPADEPMRRAASACRGLRLLRQEPWECLASFILSSSKQIVQIRQIVELLCERFGEPVEAPVGRPAAFAFPSAARLAALPESELRACKMGFRAPYLKGAAERVALGEIDLERLPALSVDEAREELLRLPGVGRKIADCVLLFAYGFQEAFPIDVWVMKGLQRLYFPRRRVRLPKLIEFSQKHFGPCGGYAQQYLFHYMRVKEPLLQTRSDCGQLP